MMKFQYNTSYIETRTKSYCNFTNNLPKNTFIHRTGARI